MDHQDFKIQVVSLKNRLFRFAKRMVDQTEEAEDIVQEVFIKLWEKRDKLDQYRSLEALAMVTTRNLCLDRIKRKKYPYESMENHRGFIENLPEETNADLSEQVTPILQAMRNLPKQQQMIIHLRDIEGYDFETIAEILSMNENAIRVNLSRARKKIREMITTQNIYEYQKN